MKASGELSSSDRLTRSILVAVGVLGAGLLLDGLVRGELRHRLAAVAIGALLLAPLLTVAWRGPRQLRRWRRLLVSALVLLGVLLAAEVFIRAFDVSAFSVATLASDPVLGHVHLPDHGGQDAWGFRNRSVPERADVVCLGDSQTFGANVRLDDTYARALERNAGLAVYNMSLGGYGPIQYVAMLERALSLQPRTVVIGFFFGNDILDANRFAGLEHWAELRDPALEYSVPDDLQRGDTRSLNLAMACVDGLLARSRLLGSVAAELKLQLKVNRALAGLYWKDGQPLSYEQGNIRTVFTPHYRLRSVDLAQADVRDGLRITGLCLERMSARCRASGVELVLLLIHTKESYYERFLAARGDERAEDLRALARAESAAAEHVVRMAAEHGLRLVDPTPEVLAALAEDAALWPQNSDGHLNPAGCALLARVLQREIAAGSAQSSPR